MYRIRGLSVPVLAIATIRKALVGLVVGPIILLGWAHARLLGKVEARVRHGHSSTVRIRMQLVIIVIAGYVAHGDIVVDSAQGLHFDAHELQHFHGRRSSLQNHAFQYFAKISGVLFLGKGKLA